MILSMFHHNVDQNSSVLYFENTIRYSFWTLFLTMGLTQFNLGKNTCFYKYAHNSGPRGSPDIILTAFDVNLHAKKDEIPPRACNPSYTFIYAILEIWGSTWNTKMVITRAPGHPQGSKFDQNDPTMSPDVLACPKGVKIH